MKRLGWILFALFTAAASLAFAATAGLPIGQPLPELRGDTLSGRHAALPRDVAGNVALLVFGFSYDSRFAVEDWIKRFRAEFGQNPKITFYEIPMIGGPARLAKWFIDGGMRKGTAKADQDHVITIYGATAPWEERLGVTAKDAAYLILLDRQGNIVWRHGGKFEESPYKDLAGQVGKLL